MEYTIRTTGCPQRALIRFSWNKGFSLIETLGVLSLMMIAGSDRAAVAAGTTLPFPHPSFDPTAYFGTDGGLHTFLRFLENWNGDTLNYKSSLVSLYYATYSTGTLQCRNYVVYQPPTRNYKFDPFFAPPQKLPPGTPMFRDIDNLTYRQEFMPSRTSRKGFGAFTC